MYVCMFVLYCIVLYISIVCIVCIVLYCIVCMYARVRACVCFELKILAKFTFFACNKKRLKIEQA